MPRGIYKRTPENTTRYWLGKKRGSLSIETKLKQSLVLKGRKMSEETKKKISESSIGKKGTYGHLGYRHTQETKDKISCKKKGFKHSYETRFKISISHGTGSSNRHWEGGKTKSGNMVRNSIEYRFWREKVFKRDNYTCQICFKRGGYLQADHIKPFALYPELRLDISNGRSLCKECHSTTDSYLSNFFKNYK